MKHITVLLSAALFLTSFTALAAKDTGTDKSEESQKGGSADKSDAKPAPPPAAPKKGGGHTETAPGKTPGGEKK